MTMSDDASFTEKREISVMCFGHPLLDMIVNVDQDFIDRYKITPGSVNLAQEEQLPLFDYIASGDKSIQYVPGGSAMNTARMLSWICPDVCVFYVGALGSDRFATILRNSLSTAGVQPLFEEHETTTGTCAVLIVEKERALVANLGAAVKLSMRHFETQEVKHHVEKASLYYAEGFFLNTASSPDSLLSVAKHAKQNRKLFCFNLNAPYISAVFKDRIIAIIPFVDYLFGGEDDILAFAEVRWPREFNMQQHHTTERSKRICTATLRIAALPCITGPRTVVTTRGSASTIIACGKKLMEVAVPRIESSEIIDLNGAGDAFVGGFLAQLLSRTDDSYDAHLVRCATLGHEAARICLRHNGSMFSGNPPALKRI